MQWSLKPPKQSRSVSCFLSLLFCILNGSSLFVCGMCFTVVIIFLTTDRDVDSFVVLVFISLLSNLIISFYILIRELLYKLIHCLGYRAQPDLRVLRMRRGFDIHFPVFEKYGQDYKLLYKKRCQISCFFSLYGNDDRYHYGKSQLEKNHRDIKSQRKCNSSGCRAWLSYICGKRRSLSSGSTA